jgi:hypothetical protein
VWGGEAPRWGASEASARIPRPKAKKGPPFEQGEPSVVGDTGFEPVTSSVSTTDLGKPISVNRVRELPEGSATVRRSPLTSGAVATHFANQSRSRGELRACQHYALNLRPNVSVDLGRSRRITHLHIPLRLGHAKLG